MIRILCYELDRHKALVERLPMCSMDDAFRETLRLSRELGFVEVGSPRFHELLDAIKAALEEHIASEEKLLRSVV